MSLGSRDINAEKKEQRAEELKRKKEEQKKRLKTLCNLKRFELESHGWTQIGGYVLLQKIPRFFFHFVCIYRQCKGNYLIISILPI